MEVIAPSKQRLITEKPLKQEGMLHSRVEGFQEASFIVKAQSLRFWSNCVAETHPGLPKETSFLSKRILQHPQVNSFS